MKLLLDTRPEISRRYHAAVYRSGWYRGYEYRIITDDSKLNLSENRCDECGEFHKTIREGQWIRPNRPLEIGKNWARMHHVKSIVERRSLIFERKKGKKTVYQGTSINYDSFQPQDEWHFFATITNEGQIEGFTGTLTADEKIRESDNRDRYTSYREGIAIYTDDISDDYIHSLIAGAIGCNPENLYNGHMPSEDPQYKYQRYLSIHREKSMKWTAMGGRMKSPMSFVKAVRDRFPYDEHVKIDFLESVDFA